MNIHIYPDKSFLFDSGDVKQLEPSGLSRFQENLQAHSDLVKSDKDLLIVYGNFTNRGSRLDTLLFLDRFTGLSYDYKVLIPGIYEHWLKSTYDGTDTDYYHNDKTDEEGKLFRRYMGFAPPKGFYYVPDRVILLDDVRINVPYFGATPLITLNSGSS